MLGYNEMFAGRFDEASANAQKGIALMERLYRLRPGDHDVQHRLQGAYDAQLVLIPPTIPASALIEHNLQLARRMLDLDRQRFDLEPDEPIANWRATGVDWNHLGIWSFLKGDHAAALGDFLQAQSAFEKTAADAHNAQVKMDLARIRMNLGRTEVAAGRLDEAREVLLKNLAALQEIIIRSDTYEIRYFRAACEEELGSIELQQALASRDVHQQLHHWQAAYDWFARSAPVLEQIAHIATLSIWDRAPVERAVAGLARSAAEIRGREQQLAAAPH